MSVRDGFVRRITLLLVMMAVAALVAAPTAGAQQTTPKAEIFLGYSYFSPGQTFGYTPADVRSQPGAPRGWGTSFAYNFTKNFAVAADYSGHYGINGNYHTLMAGPQLRLPMDRVTPFAELLLGLSKFTPDGTAGTNNAFGAIAGGGLDLNISKHFSWRVVQADYVRGANRHLPFPGYSSNIDGARVQSGLVFLLGGGPPPPPPAASCTANPTEVMAGEPVAVTATVNNWPPKKAEDFTWTATGGKVEGKAGSASVDTAGLAPGSYTVTANVTDHKKLTASCQAGFTIKEPPKNPPSVSCSANPTTVRAGTPSTVTCECTSPDKGVTTNIGNWTASSGTISGSGNTATLDTAGASAGPISVTATCTDNRGLTATSAPATVNVEVPPPPPQARDLGSINFKKNSARVDNEAKGALDQMADQIKSDPNNKAVVIGYYDAAEKGGSKLAAQRAVNTKEYLTKEKGIDPNIIDAYNGGEGGMTAKVVLVPPGATYSGGGEKIDEAAVKPTKERAHHAARHKKAAPKAAEPK